MKKCGDNPAALAVELARLREVNTAEEAAQQRTVVTSLTEGILSLRYAPRTPKASEPVNTDS